MVAISPRSEQHAAQGCGRLTESETGRGMRHSSHGSRAPVQGGLRARKARVVRNDQRRGAPRNCRGDGLWCCVHRPTILSRYSISVFTPFVVRNSTSAFSSVGPPYMSCRSCFQDARIESQRFICIPHPIQQSFFFSDT